MFERILFLDIDGVLNPSGAKDMLELLDRKGDPLRQLNSVKVKRLRQVVERHGAEIVISSTWRLGGMESMLIAFSEAGWHAAPIVGLTPVLKDMSASRGQEIQAWLDQHPTNKFVILDDDNDMLPEQMPQFVQCNPEHGLTDKEVEKIDRLLS